MLQNNIRWNDLPKNLYLCVQYLLQNGETFIDTVKYFRH